MTGPLMAVGVGAPAGLNAYIVLLVIGLVARVTGRVDLPPSLDWLANTWVLVLIGAVLTAEIFVTKSPPLAPVSDQIGYLVRPVSGAIAAVAVTATYGLDAATAAVLGALSALGVHVLKVMSRRRLSAATGGLAVPLASMLEDLAAAAGVILTLLAPLAGVAVALVSVVALVAVLALLPRRTTPSIPQEPPSAAT